MVQAEDATTTEKLNKDEALGRASEGGGEGWCCGVQACREIEERSHWGPSNVWASFGAQFSEIWKAPAKRAVSKGTQAICKRQTRTVHA